MCCSNCDLYQIRHDLKPVLASEKVGAFQMIEQVSDHSPTSTGSRQSLL